MQRYFAQTKTNDTLILYDSDCHHIKNVMRNQLFDKIEVVYENIVYICQIESLNPLELTIVDTIDESNEMNVDLTVAVALVNEQKFDMILQKLTELGISSIIPLKTERSIVKLDDTRASKKINRWQAICKEASEQSKRTKIPKVTNIMTISELTNISKELKLLCSLDETSQPLSTYLTENVSEIIFAIGPEGGFTKEEEITLRNHDYKSVSLAKRVMRVETAAIYVASIINYIYRG